MRLFLILVIVFLTSHVAAGQVKRTMRFSSMSGMFCSQTIILDSTGLYFEESGCEGRSYISIGRYKINKDNKISFQSLPFDSIKPISKIIQVESSKENDSLLTITIFDRYSQPLDINFGIRLGDTSNNVHEVWTDENGQVHINRFLFRYISFVQFLSMYPGSDAIIIGQKSLNIYLNLPELFLLYPELQLNQPHNFNLQLKRKGLYDIKSNKITYKRE